MAHIRVPSCFTNRPILVHWSQRRATGFGRIGEIMKHEHIQSMANRASACGTRRWRPAPDTYTLDELGLTFHYSDGSALSVYAPHAATSAYELEQWLWHFRAENAQAAAA